MTIEQFRERMATGEPIIGGSELHMEFHKYSQEALRITAEINGSYHAPEELRRLLSELWAINVPESFGMFPPFYTEVCFRRSIPIAARTRMSANGCSSTWAVSSKTKAVSSSTTMLLSGITPRSARSIIFLTRRKGQV